MTIKRKTLFPLFILFFMLLSEIFKYKVDYFKYTDEIIAVFFFLYILLKILLKNKWGNKNVKLIITCTIFIFFIGFISSFIFGIQISLQAVVFDIIACFKMIVCCIGFGILVDVSIAKEIIRIISFPSKLFLITGFVCGIVSLFIDINMRGQMRYGIWGFNFIFQYAHIYSMMVLFCLIICVFTIHKHRNFNIYLIIAIVQLVFTTKGISIVTAGAMIIILYYVRKKDELNVKSIILIICTSVVLGSYQISEYLMNDVAPRARFFKYGIITALSYFPLGSGFATYGSDMAAKYYSPLYIQFGFNSLYGMNSLDHSFLNDNYWPMVMGQFGFVGLLLGLIIVYRFFRIIQDTQLGKLEKAILLSAFVYMVVASIGTSIFTTSATIILGLGIILGLKMEKGKEDSVNDIC